MYKTSDKPSAVRSIQKYLSTVFRDDLYIPSTGIYDAKTKEAVKLFQNNMMLDQNGIVDYTTFAKLYEEYVKQKRKQDITKIFYSENTFPLKEGDEGNEINIINRKLIDLLNFYGFSNNINRNSNYFTIRTKDAIKTLRKIYSMKESEDIDEELYQLITLDHNSIK